MAPASRGVWRCGHAEGADLGNSARNLTGEQIPDGSGVSRAAPIGANARAPLLLTSCIEDSEGAHT